MPSQLGALRWQRPSGRSIYLLLHTGRLDLFHDQRTRVRGSFPSRRWCGRVWRRMDMCRHRPIYNLTIERTAVEIGEKERSTNKRTLSMRGKERIQVLSPASKWPQGKTRASRTRWSDLRTFGDAARDIKSDCKWLSGDGHTVERPWVPSE